MVLWFYHLCCITSKADQVSMYNIIVSCVDLALLHLTSPCMLLLLTLVVVVLNTLVPTTHFRSYFSCLIHLLTVLNTLTLYYTCLCFLQLSHTLTSSVLCTLPSVVSYTCLRYVVLTQISAARKTLGAVVGGVGGDVVGRGGSISRPLVGTLPAVPSVNSLSPSVRVYSPTIAPIGFDGVCRIPAPIVGFVPVTRAPSAPLLSALKKEGISKPRRAVKFTGTQGATIASAVLLDEVTGNGMAPRVGTHYPHFVGPSQLVVRDVNSAFLLKYDGLFMRPGWKGSLGPDGEHRTRCPYCRQNKNERPFLPIWDDMCPELVSEAPGYVPRRGDAFDMRIRQQAWEMLCEECSGF